MRTLFYVLFRSVAVGAVVGWFVTRFFLPLLICFSLFCLAYTWVAMGIKAKLESKPVPAQVVQHPARADR